MPIPTRLPLALRVGITGHRWREALHADDERLDPAHADDVRATLRTVLARIRTATHAVKRSHHLSFDQGAPTLALVSALAEGADELAAEVATEPDSGYVLDIVAPYDLATHAARCAPGTPTRSLWDKARARLVLDGVPMADEPEHGERRARHEATLVETNRRLVWNSDLIIAVWDGRDARGEAGTARVIARARAEGLPVIHVHSVTPARVVMLDAAASEPSADDPWTAIDRVVSRLLEPPDAIRHSNASSLPSRALRTNDDDPVRRAWQDYMAESVPGAIVRHFGARVYRAALWLLAGSRADTGRIDASFETATVPWQELVTASDMSARRAAVVDPQFRRADYFAAAYGERHRSTFTTILFFAPFAVVCAWAGSLAAADMKLLWAIGELLLLAVLMTFFFRSRTRRFHEKWLDYRLLAERLRHYGFLWPLGRSSPVIRVPRHAVFTDPRPAWVNWWFRGVARHAGLASHQLDESTVRALAQQIDRDLVHAQLAYNRAMHHASHRAELRLHLLPWIPLLLALLAALTHVLEHLHIVHLEDSVVTALTGVGILGPAFGAALHGFASQAGFQEVAIRTDASAQQLERFAQRLAEIDLAQPLASKALGDLALSVAEVMGEDLAGWRVDYLARPLNPPG